MESFTFFVVNFAKCVTQVRGVILGLFSGILTGAVFYSWVENVPIGDAVYFSFITALTIGYGDLVPATALGRVISIGIGVLGLIFFGVIIGISTRITILYMHPEEFPGSHAPD